MYAKLFTSIYQGTLRGNSHGLLVFTNLLAHADSAGHVDIHPKAIAEEVGLTQEQVRNALDELEAPDLESRSPEEEGRRIVRLDAHRAWGWRVVNYVKYRSIRNEEDRREQNRLAQERFRQKSKQSKPRKPESAKAEAEAEAEESPSLRSGEARKRASSPACPDDVEPQVWEDWLSLRKAKKAPVTKTAVDGAAREAKKAGMTFNAFLAVWCQRGSQGLQADWLRPDEKARGATETAYQRSMREKVASFAPGIAARAPGSTSTVIDAEVTDVSPRRLG